ncbi:hypothetical protein I7I50_10491 [Histoplasma capsulatum G186AR]|nr:hypothetical protein I7I50_10491 [Histoplasma capsulatum G186AR]
MDMTGRKPAKFGFGRVFLLLVTLSCFINRIFWVFFFFFFFFFIPILYFSFLSPVFVFSAAYIYLSIYLYGISGTSLSPSLPP